MPSILIPSLGQQTVNHRKNQQTIISVRIGNHVTIQSTNNNFTQYSSVIKINDGVITIEIMSSIDSTIIKVKK